ncbi:Adaptive-response sensory-kinase SasA [Dyadobacter sp. CECT 9623]|uniref:histidine kinase n=1 Tax=Dyadobacter linearis TaxID=2823330 RepID=A0ABM8UJE4_9BACT|nr:PAS domain S-box protein [Dyadobacter sp. CECT 9623]CAG5067629.1 Adaptive-response sensory-kinase SasA [Dyadobacter sp. CECT 9623]
MQTILLESLPEAVFQLDNFGNIQYCNAAATVLTGYEKNELSGKPVSYLTPNQVDNFKTTYELNLANTNGILAVNGWHLTKQGRKYWGEVTYSPIRQASGEQLGFACIIRDITERKNEENALIENEERFRLLVEGVQDYSIYMLDVDGNIATWNEGGQQLTGYLSSEVIGKHFSIFYNPNDLLDEKPARELETAKRTGRYDEEGWRVKKNGSVFWASIALTAVYNRENKLIGFSKVTKDLTEQNREAAALKQSEERYRLLVEQVIDYGIFMMDDKGRIASWNEGAKRIKGYDHTDVIGKYFSLFYPEEEIFNNKPAYELKIARQHGKYEEEGWRIRKDGSRFWANVVITAVYNADRVLVGFSKVTRDLTERKKAEQAEREISEKYRQIARELETINAELSRTNNDLEQFTSIVSHDLQEPLRTVKSFLHLITDRVEKGKFDDLHVFVSKSVIAANRMKELIENVLNYSQVNKGQISMNSWPIDELLEHVTQNLKGTLDATGATIYIEKQAGEVVKGDKIQLTQLFQNLLSNAIKFTNGEKPFVRLSYGLENGTNWFSITDNGIGMDAASTKMIFDPFRRLHNARNYPGAGMGLAICKKVVERHQGRLWVESEPGVGSTFHFTLWETGPKPSTTHETL